MALTLIDLHLGTVHFGDSDEMDPSCIRSLRPRSRRGRNPYVQCCAQATRRCGSESFGRNAERVNALGLTFRQREAYGRD